MKNIYISAPWRDINSGLVILQICKKVIEMGQNPVCWYTMYLNLLDFSNTKQRDRALEASLSLMPICSEVWIFGSSKTSFMQKEEETAIKHNITVVHHSVLDFLHSSS